MPAARAFMISVDDVGHYINPGDSAAWFDLHFKAIIVGVDGTLRLAKLTAHLDPAAPATFNAAIALAISDFGAANGGYTFAANQTFIPAFNRI